MFIIQTQMDFISSAGPGQSNRDVYKISNEQKMKLAQSRSRTARI